MYYTDYPIEGNESSDLIPIELLAYDRDKYVTVKYKDVVESTKSGYIYKFNGGKKYLSKKELFSLPTQAGDSFPSKRNIAKELKDSRKKKTSYSVWIDDTRSKFDTLDSTLGFVRGRISNTVHDIEILREIRKKNSWQQDTILEICENNVYDYVSRKNSARSSGFLSKKHFRALQRLAEQRKI